MRLRALCVLCALCSMPAAIGCTGANRLFRQYEYEEEMYLALDGSATMYVNSSIAALNALRGTAFDEGAARVDRDRVREYFEAPGVHVVRVSTSRRSGRRFVHVRLQVDDVRRLSSTAPFAWSTYRFERDGDHFAYQQHVGSAAGKPAQASWNGSELVAFRLHLPSKIDFHNTRREIGRGNILVWEQPLADRLRGEPLALEARIQTQSILYRTLWLFGVTFVAVVIVFAAVIWWVLRRGRAVEDVVRQPS